MRRAEVLERVRERAVALLEVAPEDVQDDKSFVDDLQVDSLSLVEFTMELEDVFGVELPEDELTQLKTIGSFVDLITTKTEAG